MGVLFKKKLREGSVKFLQGSDGKKVKLPYEILALFIF